MPDERLVAAVERVRCPQCKAAHAIHAELVIEAEWSEVTLAQVRRAVTAASARAQAPELSQAERRKRAEREREQKRDRSDRKRSVDNKRRVRLRWQREDEDRSAHIAEDKSRLPRPWSKQWFHGLHWDDPATRR